MVKALTDMMNGSELKSVSVLFAAFAGKTSVETIAVSAIKRLRTWCCLLTFFILSFC